MRRLPGPVNHRPGDGGDSEGSLHDCFGTGSEHQLNLRRGLFGVLDRKWMSGSAEMQETVSREALVRNKLLI